MDKNLFKLLVSGVYWLLLCSIPLLINYDVVSFMTEHQCMPSTACLAMVAPLLFGSLSDTTIVSAVLIWPVAFWKVIGQFVWKYIEDRRASRIK